MSICCPILPVLCYVIKLQRIKNQFVMGLIFSKFRTIADSRSRRKGSPDYERVLAELDSQIQHSEIALSETRTSERKASVYYFFYSLLFTLCLFVYLFFTASRRHPGGRSPFVDLVLVIGIPVVLYNVRRAMLFFLFRRRIAALETGLQNLRARQKLKLEELKDSTAYYQTKGLIERFDPEYRKKGGDSVRAMLFLPYPS